MSRDKFWNSVHLSKDEAVSASYSGHEYKMRINVSEADFKQYKNKIIAVMMATIQSKPIYQQAIRSYKTPTSACVDYWRVRGKVDMVDRGQFTLYTQVKEQCNAALLGLAADLQEALDKLGIAPAIPMSRDMRISFNISFRSEGVYWVNTTQQCLELQSKDIFYNEALAASYKLFMQDTNLHALLSSEQPRENEVDAIHKMFIQAYIFSNKQNDQHGVLVALHAKRFRSIQRILDRGGVLSMGELQVLDIKHEDYSFIAPSSRIYAFYTLIIERLRDKSSRLSASLLAKFRRAPTAPVVEAEGVLAKVDEHDELGGSTLCAHVMK